MILAISLAAGADPLIHPHHLFTHGGDPCHPGLGITPVNKIYLVHYIYHTVGVVDHCIAGFHLYGVQCSYEAKQCIVLE